MEALLYILLGILLFGLGGFCGYLLTRQTLFDKFIEPAIQDSYSRGYKSGIEHGKTIAYGEIADMMLGGDVIKTPQVDPLIAKPMPAADSIITGLTDDEEPQV